MLMTQDEALKRAMTGDVVAVMAIMVEQSEGRWMRLYPHGRKGPLDEGYNVFLYGYTLDRIFLTTGKVTDTLALDKSQAATSIRKSYDILTDIIESCGGDEDLLVSRRQSLLQGRTQRMSIACVPGENQVLVKLSPRGKLWSMSYRDCQQFACKLLDACDALGWGPDDLGVNDIAEEVREL
jgi:hypothetical protein